MLLLGVLWAGTALFASRELLHFVVDETTPEPEPIPEAPAEPGDVVVLRAPDSSESVAETNRSLAYSVGALALVGAGKLINPALGVLGASVLVIGAWPLTRRAWHRLTKGQGVDYEGLMLIDVSVCIGLGIPGLAAFGWAVHALGQRLLLETHDRSKQQEPRRSLYPPATTAWRIIGGVEVQVRTHEIEIGDLVAVGVDDPIPVDGRIVMGSIDVDQSALTGESRVQELGSGDPVLATTKILDGAAIVRAERIGPRTIAARVDHQLRETRSFEGHPNGHASTMAERSVRPTLATAAAGLLARGPVGAVAGLWANSTGGSWLASPYSTLNTIDAAARASILIKDGRSLEQLVGIDTVVFDKTGTLTLDHFELRALRCHGALSEERALGLAAALERGQDDPIARTIVAEARRRKIAIPRLDYPQSELGYDLHPTLEGEPLVLGSAQLMAREGIAIPSTIEAKGRSLVHLALGSRYAATLEFEPTLAPGASALVASLRGRGLNISIVSGDDEGPTADLAHRLGISHYRAHALPEDKAEFVAELQAKGRTVCFVGSGITAALALNRAKVSISLGGASPPAVRNAQVVLRSGSLMQLDLLFDIADHFAAEQKLIIDSGRLATAGGTIGLLFTKLTLPGLAGIYAGAFGLSMLVATRPRFRDHAVEQVLRLPIPDRPNST